MPRSRDILDEMSGKRIDTGIRCEAFNVTTGDRCLNKRYAGEHFCVKHMPAKDPEPKNVKPPVEKSPEKPPGKSPDGKKARK